MTPQAPGSPTLLDDLEDAANLAALHRDGETAARLRAHRERLVKEMELHECAVAKDPRHDDDFEIRLALARINGHEPSGALPTKKEPTRG